MGCLPPRGQEQNQCASVTFFRHGRSNPSVPAVVREMRATLGATRVFVALRAFARGAPQRDGIAVVLVKGEAGK